MSANRLGASTARQVKVEPKRINNYLVVCYQISCLPEGCSNRIFSPPTEEFQNSSSLEPRESWSVHSSRWIKNSTHSFGNQRLSAFDYITNRTGESCLQWPGFPRVSLTFCNGCLLVCIRSNKNVGEESLVPHILSVLEFLCGFWEELNLFVYLLQKP